MTVLKTMENPRLRFLGWHIPLEHWKEHPCWEFALDEAGREGQDETTMRPCDEKQITKHTDAVAGYAVSSNGEQFPAMISLRFPDRISAKGIMIYVDRKFDGRKVELAMRKGRWMERKIKPSWFPTWTSAKSEPGLLPVQIVSHAADKRTRSPMSFMVSEVE